MAAQGPSVMDLTTDLTTALTTALTTDSSRIADVLADIPEWGTFTPAGAHVTIAPDGVVVGGAPSAIDAWLWGRADISATRLEGDTAVADQLRALASDATQGP